MLDLDTMTETQITSNQNSNKVAHMRFPDWSPDAQDVVFAADRIGISRRDLLRVYEPLLVRRGLIARTRRGRVLN